MEYKVTRDAKWMLRSQSVITVTKGQIVKNLPALDVLDMHADGLLTGFERKVIEPKAPEVQIVDISGQSTDPAPVPDAPTTGGQYTEDQLIEIGEAGISGLREIADPMDVKGVSKRELIDGILEFQEMDKATSD